MDSEEEFLIIIARRSLTYISQLERVNQYNIISQQLERVHQNFFINFQD